MSPRSHHRFSELSLTPIALATCFGETVADAELGVSKGILEKSKRSERFEYFYVNIRHLPMEIEKMIWETVEK